ncbi:MAG: dual specificity protein phosphatase family protein, partial [Anaerolineae bacterium]|nr:dual specificity protein phosphatase family protein [Anaerolineae bacterium]
TREQLRPLLAAGVTLFLDLTEENEASSYLLDLLAEAKAQGIKVEHRRRAIPDMEIPSAEFMVGILDAIDEAIDAGQIVYVHCLGGIGRTGTVVGCYLVRHGMAGQAALDEIVRLREGRTNSPQTPEQFDMVREWSEA